MIVLFYFQDVHVYEVVVCLVAEEHSCVEVRARQASTFFRVPLCTYVHSFVIVSCESISTLSDCCSPPNNAARLVSVVLVPSSTKGRQRLLRG